MNRSIMQEVLRHVLQPLTHPERRVFNSMCADRFFWHCVAIPAGWMADYSEHVQLANIKSASCYWCECPGENMGDLSSHSERHAPQDHNVYCALKGRRPGRQWRNWCREGYILDTTCCGNWIALQAICISRIDFT